MKQCSIWMQRKCWKIRETNHILIFNLKIQNFDFLLPAFSQQWKRTTKTKKQNLGIREVRLVEAETWDWELDFKGETEGLVDLEANFKAKDDERHDNLDKTVEAAIVYSRV